VEYQGDSAEVDDAFVRGESYFLVPVEAAAVGVQLSPSGATHLVDALIPKQEAVALMPAGGRRPRAAGRDRTGVSGTGPLRCWT
jgi:hypothetical protein